MQFDMFNGLDNIGWAGYMGSTINSVGIYTFMTNGIAGGARLKFDFTR